MVDKRIVLIGNCQMPIVAECLNLMLPDEDISSISWGPFTRQKGAMAEVFAGTKAIFTQPQMAMELKTEAEKLGWQGDLRIVAPLFFMGLHPDAVYASYKGQQIKTVTAGITSAIALYAWTKGASLQTTKALFAERTFREIGYFDYWDEGAARLVESARATDVPLDEPMTRWLARRRFMHIVNHPKLFVLSDIAKSVADLMRLKPRLTNVEDLMPDRLLENLVWPVYPGIAEHLGLHGDYAFKLGSAGRKLGEHRKVLDLDQFLESSFASYEAFDDKSQLTCARFQDERFRRLDDLIASASRGPANKGPSKNPYRGLPEYQFWRSAVAGPERALVDPVVRPDFRIERTTKVATAGSCFAQHIARALASSGFNYFVAEQGPEDMSPQVKEERQYGLFSGRYGNIYTARQLLQLFERAYGEKQPVDSIWVRDDGRFVDPFRPSVEPDGYATEADLLGDREAHFAAVRGMFETLDVFVFTLGLTETWEAKADGSVFPTAPGVTSNAIDPDDYRFRNLLVSDVVADLEKFLAGLSQVNPSARVILTVSPVPLVATYEDKHVLVSTTYSKSVLRVAAETISAQHAHVTYFPSFEVVTGNHARGAYFEDDLRSVKPIAVSHVMGLFLSHYGGMKTGAPHEAVPKPTETLPQKPTAGFSDEFEAGAAVICDEERLDEGLAHSRPGLASAA